MDHLNLFTHACEQMLAGGATPEYTAQCLIATLDELAKREESTHDAICDYAERVLHPDGEPCPKGWDHI